jgi:hypothetical protein
VARVQRRCWSKWDCIELNDESVTEVQEDEFCELTDLSRNILLQLHVVHVCGVIEDGLLRREEHIC